MHFMRFIMSGNVLPRASSSTHMPSISDNKLNLKGVKSAVETTVKLPFTEAGSNITIPPNGISNFKNTDASPKSTQDFYLEKKESFSQKLENYLSGYVTNKKASQNKRVKELSKVTNVTVGQDKKVTIKLPEDVSELKKFLTKITKGHSPEGDFYPEFKKLIQEYFNDIIVFTLNKGHKDCMTLRSSPLASYSSSVESSQSPTINNTVIDPNVDVGLKQKVTVSRSVVVSTEVTEKKSLLKTSSEHLAAATSTPVGHNSLARFSSLPVFFVT